MDCILLHRITSHRVTSGAPRQIASFHRAPSHSCRSIPPCPNANGSCHAQQGRHYHNVYTAHPRGTEYLGWVRWARQFCVCVRWPARRPYTEAWDPKLVPSLTSKTPSFSAAGLRAPFQKCLPFGIHFPPRAPMSKEPWLALLIPTPPGSPGSPNWTDRKVATYASGSPFWVAQSYY